MRFTFNHPTHNHSNSDIFIILCIFTCEDIVFTCGGGGHWGVLNTATPQKIDKYRIIAKKNHQILQDVQNLVKNQ